MAAFDRSWNQIFQRVQEMLVDNYGDCFPPKLISKFGGSTTEDV